MFVVFQASFYKIGLDIFIWIIGGNKTEYLRDDGMIDIRAGIEVYAHKPFLGQGV
jgi:hypothetical protein